MKYLVHIYYLIPSYNIRTIQIRSLKKCSGNMHFFFCFPVRYGIQRMSGAIPPLPNMPSLHGA